LEAITKGITSFQEKTAQQRLFVPGRLFVFSINRSDVLCLEAFGPLGDVEFDRLAFLQAANAACLDSWKMHKNVVARLAADEAEAFGVVKPLHCSLFHLLPVSNLNFC